MVPLPSVVLYSRRTCALCDEAREVILRERERTPFDLMERFVDQDEDLERTYGVRVPVVEIDGEEAFELHIDPARFHEALAGPG